MNTPRNFDLQAIGEHLAELAQALTWTGTALQMGVIVACALVAWLALRRLRGEGARPSLLFGRGVVDGALFPAALLLLVLTARWALVPFMPVGLLRLAERQGADEAERARLRARMIDVHQRLRRHWLLPVNSYGLKAVAGWRGFHWSQSGVDGARCLLWWRQWRLGGRLPRRGRHQLGRIFLYNRDDCRATWMVARWLLEQEGA